MRVLSIKLDWNGGVSEYKVTSEKGCAYKNLMKGLTKLAFQEYVELYDSRYQDLRTKLDREREYSTELSKINKRIGEKLQIAVAGITAELERTGGTVLILSKALEKIKGME